MHNTNESCISWVSNIVLIYTMLIITSQAVNRNASGHDNVNV